MSAGETCACSSRSEADALAVAYLKHCPDESPLVLAVESRDARLVELLVRHKAALNVVPGRPDSAESPLAVCAWTNQQQLASVLVSLGAKANLNDSRRLIREGLLSNDLWIRWVLSDWVTPAAATDLLWTAAASPQAEPCRLAVVARLLELKADPNANVVNGRRLPYPLVALATSPPVVGLLAAAGARISDLVLADCWSALGYWREKRGRLPEHFTAATLQALLRAGLDPGKRGTSGRTLLGMALRAEDQDVCRLLLTARPRCLFELGSHPDPDGQMQHEEQYPTMGLSVNHLLRHCGNLDLIKVRILLAAGAHPDAGADQRPRGCSYRECRPFDHAFDLGNHHHMCGHGGSYLLMELLCLLVEHGASLDKGHLGCWMWQPTCSYRPCSSVGSGPCPLRAAVYRKLGVELGGLVGQVLFRDAASLVWDYLLPDPRHSSI